MAEPARQKPYSEPSYWEQEAGEEVRTGRVYLAYFEKAGKLQVGHLWYDHASGDLKRKKATVLDLEELRKHPQAVALLKKVLKAIG